MPRVAIKAGHPPATVELEDGAERSCAGALHLYPGQYRQVTDDELEQIREDKLQVDVLPDAPASPTQVADEQEQEAAPPKKKRAAVPAPEAASPEPDPQP